MLTFASRQTYGDREHKAYVFSVQSSKCFYQVVVEEEEVRVVGPGVEKTFSRTEMDEDTSPEGVALIYVILFEEDRS